jgi:hypothetical protein
MKIRDVMSVVLLLGAAGCSVQPEPNPTPGTTQVAGALVTAGSTNSTVVPGVKFAAGQASAPTSAGPAPARTAMSPPAIEQPGPGPTPTFNTAAQAAAAGKDALASVVGLDRSTKRGFASAADVSAATLADGLPVQFVRLDSLTAFTPGQDTKALPFDKKEVMYPISAGGVVRSSVTVQQGPDGKWQAVKFGSPVTAQASQAIRLDATSKRSVDTASFALIEIPAVHAFLLSHSEKGVHMVTPLWDIPGTSYTAGVTQPAAKVFAALQPIAAKTDPGPPAGRR